MQLAREGERVDDARDVVGELAQPRARELEVEEPDVEGGVVDDQFGAARRTRGTRATSANRGLSRRSSSVRPCTGAPRSIVALGVEVGVEVRAGERRSSSSTQPISMMRSPSLA